MILCRRVLMPKLINFFGTLGTGKTTRAQLLSGFLGVPCHSEKADSPYLEDMFLNRENALLNQLHFLYRDKEDILEQYRKSSSSSLLIFDYNIAQVKAFSDYFLNRDEYQEFIKHYDAVTRVLPLPDLIIYLKLDEDSNLVRIGTRDRPYEKVDKDFITLLQKKQFEYLEELRSKTQVIELDSSKDIINSLSNRLEFLREIVLYLHPLLSG